MWPSTMAGTPLTISSRQGTSLRMTSWMRWLGVATARCRLATVAMGPRGLCGATEMPWASAMAAIRRTSLMPPVWHTSGWATAMAPRSKKGRKAQRPMSRSPVATGIPGSARATATCPSTSSGGTGSSKNQGS